MQGYTYFLVEAVLTCTHNICFGAKIRKIGIPLHTPVLLYISEVQKVYIIRTCLRDACLHIHTVQYLNIFCVIDCKRKALLNVMNIKKKAQVGKDQEKAQSEKDSHSKNRGGKKQTNNQVLIPRKHIVSRMSSYFPNRWPHSYLNLTKIMTTYIRRQQLKNFKHQDIKQKEPPQTYRLGTISSTKLLAGLNRYYMAITSPSASAMVHNI